jgi:hypothetical protein
VRACVKKQEGPVTNNGRKVLYKFSHVTENPSFPGRWTNFILPFRHSSFYYVRGGGKIPWGDSFWGMAIRVPLTKQDLSSVLVTEFTQTYHVSPKLYLL